MNLRRVLYVLLCLGAAILEGCNSGNGVGAVPILTRVRVVNLIPNAPGIILTLDTDAPLVSGLGFEQLTQYIDVTSGTREFKVSADGGATTLIDVTLPLANGVDYTFIVYGPVEAANSQLEVDGGIVNLNEGTFLLRMANLAPGVGAIDVYLTAAGADLSLTAPVIAAVAFGATTVFVSVTTGSYELRVTPNGTKEVIYDTGVIDFGDKAIVQAAAFGKGSGKLVNVAVMNIDAQGTGQVYQNLLAEFKLVNASSVGSPLNVLVDGTLTLANVPFAGVSNYEKTSTGSRNISIESAATPGASLLALTANFASATDSSIIVSGPSGALRALVLTDNNLPSAAGRARVRFVNASPDVTSVDAYANFAKIFSGILSNSASAYTELIADPTGTAYEFDFSLAGTTTAVLKLPNVTIAGGSTYTVYVVGPASALQGVVVSDH
jgi:hypothetical protein